MNQWTEHLFHSGQWHSYGPNIYSCCVSCLLCNSLTAEGIITKRTIIVQLDELVCKVHVYVYFKNRFKDILFQTHIYMNNFAALFRNSGTCSGKNICSNTMLKQKSPQSFPSPRPSIVENILQYNIASHSNIDLHF